MDIPHNPMSIAQIAISMFLAIVFLQSSIDKLTNWKGNLDWITGHFSKTFLSSLVTPMLATLTIIELMTGVLSALGAFCVVFCADERYAYYALLFSLISYLMLLFGQRVAQDYEGAKTIAIYFGVSLIGLLFFI